MWDWTLIIVLILLCLVVGTNIMFMRSVKKSMIKPCDIASPYKDSGRRRRREDNITKACCYVKKKCPGHTHRWTDVNDEDAEALRKFDPDAEKQNENR